ncbi:MAG: peptidoglycan DD-metalloendopeptidase family protein [Pseudomonadota bacterium]
MRRPTSPLLHDYKPSAESSPKKSKAPLWFVIGLGLPLIGVAMLAADNEPTAATVVEAQPLIAVPAETTLAAETIVAEPSVAEPSVAEPSEEAIISAVPLVYAPEPEYDSLTLTVSRGDTLDKLFRRNDLDIGDLTLIAKLDDAREQMRRIKPGDEFDIKHNEGRIISLYTEVDMTSALQVERLDDGFAATMVERPIEIRKRMAYGLIETSLYESGVDAGLSDKVIMNLAGIFAWDVDFILDIRSGDNFYVQWEEIWQDGEFVTDGEIVVAEFNNRNRTTQAVRFVNDEGRSDYFTPDGRSVRKAFLRAPVDFRVSSPFNPRRLHPVLKTVRPHRGVDYAAPHGTPIKAAGDGKVTYRGTQRGYGNVVILQHGGNITTLYAHMSRFASSVKNGSRVRQGQTIGYVGKTGLVTGVHLHYEYRVNGVHRNPRTVDLPQADPIEDKYRERFLAMAEPLFKELDQFKRTQLASVAPVQP